MSTTAEQLFQKLKTMPTNQLDEVDDFVEFIKRRRHDARRDAEQRMTDAMNKLDALTEPPLSDEELQAEIQAARAERRSGSNADRR